MKIPVLACPVCGAGVQWSTENRWRPFCSERCKMIDLGNWAAETYRVPVAPSLDDDETPDSGERPQ